MHKLEIALMIVLFPTIVGTATTMPVDELFIVLIGLWIVLFICGCRLTRAWAQMPDPTNGVARSHPPRPTA